MNANNNLSSQLLSMYKFFYRYNMRTIQFNFVPLKVTVIDELKEKMYI